ncbi:hypothetical protein HMPREF1549_01387 [Actinomyces johnsonii F0510]|uniref:Uncharacterized protein n=1 Tax=Actinomyces johnsonii F0510 TaxID=1227262 RepID=U1QBM3_9ACTO|nr:hypothetical protein HMPREF1549_01387 [Actinomyces johnsonii F0510]
MWVLGVSAPAGSGGTGRTGRQSTCHRRRLTGTDGNGFRRGHVRNNQPAPTP